MQSLTEWQQQLSGYSAGVLSLFIIALLMAGYILRGQSYLRMITARPLLFIMALGAVLRIPLLFTASLWYDETFTAAVARLPLDKLWTVVQSDVHPPLWYLIEHVVVRLIGSSEIALRLPAYCFSLLSIYLVWRLAEHFEYSRFALWAALLMAVMPAHLNYANDARAYSMLVCGVLVLILAIIEDRPTWFVIGGLLTVYAHNLGYVYVGALGLYALWQARRLQWRMIIVGIGGALWLPFLLGQTQDIADGFWMMTIHPGQIIQPLITMTIGGQIEETFVVPLSLLTLLLTILSVYEYLDWRFTFLYTRLKQRPQYTGLWFVAALGVPALVALVSSVWRNVYLDRALLPSVTLLAVITWAKLIDRYSWARVGIGALLFAAVCSYYDPSVGRVPVRERLAGACDGRPVFAYSLPAAFIANYYLTPPTLWSKANDLNQSLSPEAKAALFTLGDEPHVGDCILQVETPLTSQAEHEAMARLHLSGRLISKNTIYQLSVQQVLP